jgi:negative regulator of flagellin synthesis FlgM
MTHKIEGLDGRPVGVTGGASVARPRDVGQENRTQENATKPARSDIEITPAARQLAALEKVLAQIPVVDEARVKAISSAIADGRYEVDAGKVAERLMRSDAELTEAQRRDR